MSTPTISPTFQSAATTTDFAATPGAGPLGPGSPGTANRGFCTLTFKGRVFRFRTNPNEIWWNYELITKVHQTYGGRVVQLLGTRLGDLSIKVEAGRGGWPYLIRMVTYLRELMSEQRGVQPPATFEYTTRNWRMNVYSLTIPFEDRVEATTREVQLNFKIQEDLTGVASQLALDAEIARLQEGVYGPGRQPHNKYNDPAQMGKSEGDPLSPGGPAYAPSGITNTVDSNPQGDNPGGLNVAGALPFLPSIPGLGSLSSIVGGEIL
jgi:hypothetical protein